MDLPKTIGGTADRMLKLRGDIKAANAVVDGLKKEKTALEEHFYALCDKQNTDRGAGRHASASISEDELYNVDDWEIFYMWMRRNNAMYLLQRRISNAAMRDLVAQRRGHKPIPGTKLFEKRKVNLRAKS